MMACHDISLCRTQNSRNPKANEMAASSTEKKPHPALELEEEVK
jgi:hypothetical protein